jgi:hypothetical protein
MYRIQFMKLLLFICIKNFSIYVYIYIYIMKMLSLIFIMQLS